jgi:hypothetical protein
MQSDDEAGRTRVERLVRVEVRKGSRFRARNIVKQAAELLPRVLPLPLSARASRHGRRPNRPFRVLRIAYPERIVLGRLGDLVVRLPEGWRVWDVSRC